MGAQNTLAVLAVGDTADMSVYVVGAVFLLIHGILVGLGSYYIFAESNKLARLQDCQLLE